MHHGRRGNFLPAFVRKIGQAEWAFDRGKSGCGSRVPWLWLLACSKILSWLNIGHESSLIEAMKPIDSFHQLGRKRTRRIHVPLYFKVFNSYIRENKREILLAYVKPHRHPNCFHTSPFDLFTFSFFFFLKKKNIFFPPSKWLWICRKQRIHITLLKIKKQEMLRIFYIYIYTNFGFFFFFFLGLETRMSWNFEYFVGGLTAKQNRRCDRSFPHYETFHHFYIY